MASLIFTALSVAGTATARGSLTGAFLAIVALTLGAATIYRIKKGI